MRHAAREDCMGEERGENCVHFTVEQIYLTDAEGRPAPHRVEFHLVEAETVDSALEQFLHDSNATLVGSIEKFPGFHAFAKARAGTEVFTLQLLPGSDSFRRVSRS
jgi:hypothetical protein